ncbi:MAG TPA: DUF2520 domain-containing protein [Candidatus Aminicenantes bacterium]|nr:DUF2520 domain-containing protein [Candidatus Aminicenantes bacterium]HPS99091.1 DUF2520 domain-containing protein [Candidatus Aminicenantes bacterium]
MAETLQPPVVIWGSGRAASSLALRWKGVGRSPLLLTRRLDQEIGLYGLESTTEWNSSFASAPLLLLALPDREIPGAVDRLSSFSWRGRTVVTLSGLLPSAVLTPLKEKGGRTLAAHPLFSFPRRFMDTGETPLLWAWEGSDEALEEWKSLWSPLQDRYLFLPPEKKALYHASLTLISNYPFYLMEWGRRLLNELFPEEALEIFKTLSLQSLQGFLESGSISGPLARGDRSQAFQEADSLKDPKERESFRRLLLLCEQIKNKEIVP